MFIEAVVFVSALVLSYAFSPKPPAQKSLQPEEVKTPTANEGDPIPVLFGTKTIRATNVVWCGDVRAVPIKKKGGKK
jgi:hypothetical protein